MSLDRFRLLSRARTSWAFPELELDYGSRHALRAATLWIRGILGFVVFEVGARCARACAEAYAGAGFPWPRGSPLQHPDPLHYRSLHRMTSCFFLEAL